MPELFPLPLFPEGALSSSIITTVWIGVAVVVFFNLRFGWVLSGLVVPGYMVPLLLAKPAAAAVVLGEGVVTYALVWFYSEYLSRHGGWSNFFGRDRFFALVLTSVLVRIIGDGFLLPALGEWFNRTFQLQFDYRNNLHSFGLIIVALIANNFWKTGLMRGMIPLIATVAITLLIVRYGLMALTNFNISTLSYLYEDVAASILASPKAYIILLATCFLASRMNMLYGWDFSGILVPSLLALQWYQPGKILVSLIEATIILLLADLVLKTPIFRGKTIEGGRKLLLFFNLSYAYKLALAYLILWLAPEQKITDAYGFGYLLPTLIAMKMHDKGIYARMTRATLQTSLTACLGATAIGFILSYTPDPWNFGGKPMKSAIAAPLANSDSLTEVVRQEKIAMYRTRLQNSFILPTGFELDRFKDALKHLADYRREDNRNELEIASKLLMELGFQLEFVESRYLTIREREPRRYWGLYVLDLKSTSDLAIEVPAPIDEKGSAESGAWLFRLMGAQALAIGGAMRESSKDGSSDVLLSPNTMYQAFHQVFGTRELLQVRAYNTESARMVGGKRRESDRLVLDEPQSSLWIKRTLPNGLDLGQLKSLIKNIDIQWGELPLRNLQRDTLYSGFVELRLRQDDVRQLLGKAILIEKGLQEQRSELGIEGYLQEWLLADKTRIAPTGSNLYRKPTVEDLLFFEDEIIAPLLDVAANHYRAGKWTETGLESLRVIQATAAVRGYELVRYHHTGSGADYLILIESSLLGQTDRTHGFARYWGTYVFRLGESEPFLIQSPRPIFEVNSFELAVSLFESLHGKALLIGGASPDANLDRTADITKMSNKENLFNVVNQAILRKAGNAPMMVVQSRAIAERRETPMPASDILLATAVGPHSVEQLSVLGKRLIATINRHGMSFEFAQGQAAATGYEVGGLPLTFYLASTQNKEFAMLWASPLARAGYAQQSEPTAQQAHSMALGLPTIDEDLKAYIDRHGNTLAPLPAMLRETLASYFSSQDIVTLHRTVTSHPELRFERVVDTSSRQGYLAILDKQRRLVGLVNLTARQADTTTRFKSSSPSESIESFVDGRHAWLLAEDSP